MHDPIMKLITAFLCFFIIGAAQAQNRIPVTESFTIEGRVKSPFTFSLNDAGRFKTVSIDSVMITNHLLQKRNTIRSVKGILLKDLLNTVTIDAPGPKELSEYYLVCIASDDYKVVFSWNELFNSATGDHTMIITEKDGMKGADMPDRIALLTPTDQATGRRFVKGLKKIIIEKVQ